MEVEKEGEEIKKVVGQRCKEGKKYAHKEVFFSGRILTTTVKTDIPGSPLLPVRSEGELPRERLMDCMDCISKQSVSGSVESGETVMEDILGLGVNIVACRTLPLQLPNEKS
jgi:CxxC motif-containing protein